MRSSLSKIPSAREGKVEIAAMGIPQLGVFFWAVGRLHGKEKGRKGSMILYAKRKKERKKISSPCPPSNQVLRSRCEEEISFSARQKEEENAFSAVSEFPGMKEGKRRERREGNWKPGLIFLQKKQTQPEPQKGKNGMQGMAKWQNTQKENKIK